MNNEIKINDEFYERIKKQMKDFSEEELKEWRNKLMDLGKIDNKMLALLNIELLDRACEKIEIKNNKSK